MTAEIPELIPVGDASQEGIRKEPTREPPPVATRRSAAAHAATTGARKSARATTHMRSGAQGAHEGARGKCANPQIRGGTSRPRRGVRRAPGHPRHVIRGAPLWAEFPRDPSGRGLPASGLPLPGPTREPGRDGRYSAKLPWRSRWSCGRPARNSTSASRAPDTTVREAAFASRTVPPPAGNEAAASPSPLDPVQRADPRRTHRNVPAATETERTHGRTATHTGSTRHAPHARSYKNLAIRDTTS